ncbi:rna-directed dna polymerase from mobile element jockey-like [Limosa lapponica baueri]|uniref:Rna-directed dna polymerase from mobile element jockey-like n=1 Tax=Limosa lapponica baueri TaxID=1758121 RepID=A0A2I0UPT4_LIMLA|nr:rna-directed dna polymerase from mobile element jockey-like [Limosa lapponica baueri]
MIEFLIVREARSGVSRTATKDFQRADRGLFRIILSAIRRHMKDNQVIRPSQHGFMKGKSCLANLISFYDKVTCLVDDRKAVAVVYLDFSKAFDMFSRSILLEKLDVHVSEAAPSVSDIVCVVYAMMVIPAKKAALALPLSSSGFGNGSLRFPSVHLIVAEDPRLTLNFTPGYPSPAERLHHSQKLISSHFESSYFDLAVYRKHNSSKPSSR